jgi:hypothetical protein
MLYDHLGLAIDGTFGLFVSLSSRSPKIPKSWRIRAGPTGQVKCVNAIGPLGWVDRIESIGYVRSARPR